MKKAEPPARPQTSVPTLGEIILREHDKRPSSVSTILEFTNLLRNDSFPDLDVVRLELNQLKKSIGLGFEFELLSHQKALSVVDADLSKLPQVPYAYKVTMDNWQNLSTYVAAQKEKIKQIHYEFYLIDVSKNESELRLVGSEKKPPRMRKSQRRYKLLHYLIERKGKVTTAELADEFGIKEIEVRDTVTAIKDIVAKVFKIPRDAIFENDSTGTGYCVNNVQFK